MDALISELEDSRFALAGQSNRLALNAALVGEIQDATNSVVVVTEEGYRTAEEATVAIQQTVSAFGSLAETVSDNVQQVMLNSRQQAVVLGEIGE